MEQKIRDQYGPHVTVELARRYDAGLDDLKPLGGFESYVFELKRRDTPLILRVSHSLHRPIEQILAEIDWLNYLADAGVSVCRALPSAAGHWAETMEVASGHFTATLFEKARGGPVDQHGWGPTLFGEMGRMMGEMHRLTRQYRPRTAGVRPDWDEEDSNLARDFVPRTDPGILAGYSAIIEETRALSEREENYGLVHLDFHRGNFFVADGRIRLFDFDDCQYSWFADDIAMALFYAVPHDCSSPEDLSEAKHFLSAFLAGYRERHDIEGEALEMIPLFLKRREFSLYAVIHRSMDLSKLDAWPASFMRDRTAKLLGKVPYVDLDYSGL